MKTSVVAISYGDDAFKMSRDLNLWTAIHIGGAKRIIAYGPKDLDTDFVIRNKEILGQRRGGGYWIWKPYIILKTLEELAEGEYLFYTDAGMVYCHSIQCLINIMEKEGMDIFLSTGFAPAKDWCKRDAFLLMDCDTPDAINRIMVSGGYVLLKKSEISVQFIKEWLEYAQDKRILTDCPNELGLPNYEGFYEHRHDQAILSNLCFKHAILTFKGLSHADEPRVHLPAKKGVAGSYGYTFEERLRLIKAAHNQIGYKKSNYPRIFINTRIRDCNIILFSLKLIKKILNALYVDIWGNINDKRYLKKV